MGWYWIVCPKMKRNVTWKECLSCKDLQKHPTCPLRNVRIDAYPRQYEIGTYHVTELIYPLSSYYERTNPYAMDWNEYWDLLYGKALGWYIEWLHARHTREVEVEEKLSRYTNGTLEYIKIIGSADLIGEQSDQLIEIKFYYSTFYIAKEMKPHEAHKFQAQAYYRMGLKCKPQLFENIKKITILYYGKTKSAKIPRRIEISVPLEPIGEVFERNAWLLHDALINKDPSKLPACPKWKCRYCKHVLCTKRRKQK